jgi:integrase
MGDQGAFTGGHVSSGSRGAEDGRQGLGDHAGQRVFCGGFGRHDERQLKSGKLKPLTRRGVLQTLRRAMRSTGLHASQGAKGSHDLRRHAAIEILRATGNLRAAQRLLGHADIKSTLVYADVDEADIRAGLESVLSKAIGHNGGPKLEPEKAGDSKAL